MDSRGLSQVSLKHCSGSNTDTEVSFGDDGTNSVCWTTEASAGLNETEKTALTDLFSSKWIAKDTNSWGDGPSYKASCILVGSGWALVNPEGNKEYLGFCPTTSRGNNFQESFLEVDKPERGNVTLKLCKQDCYTDSVSASLRELQTPNTANWKDVKFYSISQ